MESAGRDGRSLQVGDCRLSGGLVGVRHDDVQGEGRALGPLLVEQLDGGDAVDFGRVAGDVGLAHPEMTEGQGHGCQDGDRDQAEDDRAANDQPDEAGPQARALVAIAGEERDPAEVDAIAEDREGGRQEREASDD